MGENTHNEQSVCVKKPRSGDLLVKESKKNKQPFCEKSAKSELTSLQNGNQKILGM